MDPQTIRVPDFSQILGAIVEGDKYTHMASIERRKTVCGERPSNFLMGHDFFLNCPKCLAEIQWRSEHPECCKVPLGDVTHEC